MLPLIRHERDDSMKYIIQILLLLLLLLIGTCVYQKTYTIYELTHTDDENRTQTLAPKALLNSNLASLEKHKTASHSSVKQPASTKQIPVQDKTANASSSKETTIFEKIKATVRSTVTSDDKKDKTTSPKSQTTHPSIQGNNAPSAKATATPIDTELKEKEVVEYLLGVLKERETTLESRDDAENKLQILIKKVLEDRQHAIESMQKHAQDVQNEHDERLKMRDETAEAIYKKYTKNKGN